jgi:carboxypeptidase C (cathepsin A)
MESRLASALIRNPRLKVFLQVGRSDLVVPQDAMRFSITQLPIPKSLQANITYGEYDSGHMMYFHLPDAVKFRKDTLEFIQSTLK